MLQKLMDGRTDLVFELIAGGQPPSTSELGGTSLIAWCAYHGDVTAVRYLLQNGETLDSLGDNWGLSAAAFHGHWQLCQFLLEEGADPNYAAPDTLESALHAALSKANRPNSEFVVQLLLSAGALPNARTAPGVECDSFMRDARTKSETALHRAAAYGSEKCIQLLLDAGGELDAKDVNGDTPLSWASWHLRPATILRLLSYGGFTVHPNNVSTYDHGVGWEMPRGRPHIS